MCVTRLANEYVNAIDASTTRPTTDSLAYSNDCSEKPLSAMNSSSEFCEFFYTVTFSRTQEQKVFCI